MKKKADINERQIQIFHKITSITQSIYSYFKLFLFKMFKEEMTNTISDLSLCHPWCTWQTVYLP